MIPLNSFRIIDIATARPGAFLLKCEGDPCSALLIFSQEGGVEAVEISSRHDAFRVEAVPSSSGAYMELVDYRLLVDWTRLLDPVDKPIPNGAVCLFGDQACIVVQREEQQILVGFDGNTYKIDATLRAFFEVWSLEASCKDGSKWELIISHTADEFNLPVPKANNRSSRKILKVTPKTK